MKSGKGSAASRAVAKQASKGKCNCWEGYDRAPGTKPCAPGSCVKASGKAKR